MITVPLIFHLFSIEGGARHPWQLSAIATAIATWLGALSRSHGTRAHHKGGANSGEVQKTAQGERKGCTRTWKTNAPRAHRVVHRAHRAYVSLSVLKPGSPGDCGWQPLFLPLGLAVVGLPHPDSTIPRGWRSLGGGPWWWRPPVQARRGSLPLRSPLVRERRTTCWVTVRDPGPKFSSSSSLPPSVRGGTSLAMCQSAATMRRVCWGLGVGGRGGGAFTLSVLLLLGRGGGGSKRSAPLFPGPQQGTSPPAPSLCGG